MRLDLDRQRLAILMAACILWSGCELVIEDPNLNNPVSPTPFEQNILSDQQARLYDTKSTETPAYPILLKNISRLENVEGALILTRGKVLNDVAMLSNYPGIIYDLVLDDNGSLRLTTNPLAINAINENKKLITGIIRTQKDGAVKLEVTSVDDLPDYSMYNLTIDDRPHEPGERLSITPGLHRISVESPGIVGAEFLLNDKTSGPVGVIGQDNDPRDGLSTTWISKQDSLITIHSVGFTHFGEQIEGPSLDVLVGPSLLE